MAIEFIPKPEIKKSSPGENFLFYLAIIFLIGTLISLLFLGVEVRNSRRARGDLQAKILAQADQEKEAEVTEWREKMKDYNFIFNLHQIPSNVFILFEETIHPKIWLNHFKLNPETRIVEIKGRVPNFLILAEQMLILENHEWVLENYERVKKIRIRSVEEIELTEISLGQDGDIKFQMRLLLRSEIFKPKL